MMKPITKGQVLSATHYGLGVYAHILRKYYPGETVIHLNGRDCGLCRNPFANDEVTLHIWIEKDDPTELVRHHDSSGIIPDGDAFTFAEQHYHLTGDELLNTLASELNIHQEEEPDIEESPVPEPVFSFFRAPASNIKPYKSITLYDAYLYIIGKPAQKRTEVLRSIADAEQKKRYKRNSFDYCCFSGTFTQRSNNSLIKHSGLMCIDFDHLSDLEALRQKLLFDDFFETQLLFRSPSGDGLKWIIPVELDEFSHGEYFSAVSNYILNRYNVQIDKSGRDVSRACFMPFDPNAYINPVILRNHGR